MTHKSYITTVFVDVFGTALIAHEETLEAYAYILQEIGFRNVPKQLRDDHAELMTNPAMGFEEYAEKASQKYRQLLHVGDHESVRMHTDYNQDMRQTAVAKAKLIFDDHAKSHHVREEWLEFLATAQQKYDLKVCLASNLAVPYIQTVEENFPEVENKFYSCEVGAMKPSRQFFYQCCGEMGVNPKRAVMIGNNLRSDVRGAQLAGLAAAFWAPEESKNVDADMFAQHSGIRNLNEIFPRLQDSDLLPR